MSAASALECFDEVARAIRDRLDHLADWGRADGHAGQYRHDVVADEIAVPMLLDAGYGVVSEESGDHHLERDVVAVLDPIDGSTNASMGLPWFATSICAVDCDGPLAALVVNQAIGVTYTATRGGGARRDGEPISVSPCRSLGDAIVVFNDLPSRRAGWRQFRVYGAAALDLCAVADGTFDAFYDCGVGLSPWDYLGGGLIATEAGAVVRSLDGRDLHVTDGDARRPVAAASHPDVLDPLVAGLAPSAPDDGR